MASSTLTLDVLNEVVSFDRQTGFFYWSHKPRKYFTSYNKYLDINARFSGKRADRLNKSSGYMEIKIFGKRYKAHRLAWLIVYGSLPKHEIDHIDGDTTNNKISNLRDVTHEENSKNRKLRSDNKSGVPGVYLHKASGLWEASISVGKSQVVIGYFADKSQAIHARKSLEACGGYHKNHGRRVSRIC